MGANFALANCLRSGNRRAGQRIGTVVLRVAGMAGDPDPVTRIDRGVGNRVILGKT